MGQRRTVLLIGCIMLIFSLTGCGGGGSSGGDGGGGSAGAALAPSVTVAGPKQGQNTIQGTVGFTAAGVLAIIPDFNGNVDKATVATDRTFRVYAFPEPAVVLFLDGRDQLIGHLAFSNGMTSYPLENLPAEASSDLGTLAITGPTVTPSRDPFSDGDISFSQADQRALKTLSSAFSSVAVHPDADGNGTIDVLENRFYLPYMGYYLDGSFGNGSLTAAVATPAVVSSSDLCFRDQSTSSSKPTTGVSFSGPSGSGLSNTPARSIDTATGSYCSPAVQGILPAGLYTATYNGGQLGFNLPDQSTASQDILIIIPTVVLNSDGTIKSLTWTYRLGDGTSQGAINPANVITGLHIYMTDKTGNDRAYDSGATLSAAATTHVLTNQKLKWTDIDHVEIDLYTWYKGCVIFYFANNGP
jgi:hypothetical protein